MDLVIIHPEGNSDQTRLAIGLPFIVRMPHADPVTTVSTDAGPGSKAQAHCPSCYGFQPLCQGLRRQ
jgi:hypothetical protein